MAAVDRSNPREPRTQVVPIAERPDLFEFLEGIFGNEKYPEKIELRQMKGRGFAQKGPIVKLWPYKPSQPKPTREQLVAQSNECLSLSQSDCDGIGRPQVYGVLAYHFATADDYFGRKLIPMRPKSVASKDEDDEFDDDDLPSEKIAKKQLVADMLLHYRFMFDKTLLHYQSSIERLQHQIERRDEKLDQAWDRIIVNMEKMETLLDRKQERDFALRREEMKLGVIQEGVELVKGFLPPILSAVMPEKVAASAEALTVRQFLESVTPEQGTKAFGYDEAAKDFRGGIFTADQGRALLQIAMGQSTSEQIDGLISSIAPEQMVAAQQIFGPQQLGPLITMVVVRQNKKTDTENSHKKM